jgi:hypothetical protein
MPVSPTIVQTMIPTMTPTAVEYAVRIVATPTEGRHFFGLSINDIVADIIAAIALMASIVSVVVSKSSADRDVIERKVILYAKLEALQASLRQFYLIHQDESKLTKTRMGNGNEMVNIRLDGEPWKNYEIKKDEQIEFALMDIEKKQKGLKLIGLRKRLKNWFEGPKQHRLTAILFQIRESQLRLLKLQNVKLIESVQIAMNNLEKDFKRKHKSYLKKNRKKDVEWADEYNKELEKQRIKEALEWQKNQSSGEK